MIKKYYVAMIASTLQTFLSTPTSSREITMFQYFSLDVHFGKGANGSTKSHGFVCLNEKKWITHFVFMKCFLQHETTNLNQCIISLLSTLQMKVLGCYSKGLIPYAQCSFTISGHAEQVDCIATSHSTHRRQFTLSCTF